MIRNCLGLFVAMGVMAAGANITIADPTVSVIRSGTGSSPIGTVTASLINQTAGNSILNATACYNGYCPGQAAPGAGPTFQVSGPFTLKITDLTFECNTAGNAGSACALSLGGFFDWIDVDLAGATVPISVTFDGTGPNTSSAGFVIEVNSCDLDGNNCVSVNSGGVPAVFTGNAFSRTLDLGNFTLLGRSHAELDVLLANVPINQTVTIPGSLTVTFGTPLTAPGDPVPEPATYTTLLAGLTAIGYVAARRARSRG